MSDIEDAAFERLERGFPTRARLNSVFDSGTARQYPASAQKERLPVARFQLNEDK